jgi:hypothetical protein
MKILRTLGFIFGGIGLVLLIATLLVVQHANRFLEVSKTAPGVVTELRLGSTSSSSTSRSYHPVIRYTPEGADAIEVVSSFGSNPPRYSTGDAVTVRYDPASPYRARIDGFWGTWFPVVILGGLTVLFGVPGAVLVIVYYRTQARIEWLRLHGRLVSTDFQAVVLNSAVQVNGRSPYQIVTRWKNRSTGIHHTFKSQYLFEDPTPYVEGGRAIIVRIDPNNPKRYIMDLSFLPSDDSPHRGDGIR